MDADAGACSKMLHMYRVGLELVSLLPVSFDAKTSSALIRFYHLGSLYCISISTVPELSSIAICDAVQEDLCFGSLNCMRLSVGFTLARNISHVILIRPRTDMT